MNARYDDVWCGGWDELFPNDEIASIGGESYPDHGEAWTADWKAEPFEKQGEVGVVQSVRTPISSIYIEKTITLRANESRLRFRHKFTNEGGSSFPFLWKLHPAFAVSSEHRIDFPPMKVVLDPAFVGTLDGAVSSFAVAVCATGWKESRRAAHPDIDQKAALLFLWHRDERELVRAHEYENWAGLWYLFRP